MRRLPGLVLASLAGLLLLVGGSTSELRAEPQAILEAGFARGDLTPDRPVPLGGYAARKGKLSEGVHDPVEVRAVFFRNRSASLAIASVDLIGVSAKFRTAVLGRLDDLPPFDLILAATHNHAGPGGLTDVPIWQPAMGPFDAALFEHMVARVADCVRRAHADLAPAHIGDGAVEVDGLQRNRAQEDGAVDSDLGVIRVDAPDGTPRGVLCHFAAHPTLLGPEVMQISAGWPGALCRALERDLPGATALFLNGAMGDIAPTAPATERPDAEADAFAPATRYGETLARRALALRATLDGNMATDPWINVWTHGVKAQTVMSALLGRSGAAALGDIEPFELPVTRICLGDLWMLTLPGEPTAAAPEALWRRGRQRWVISCAQDHLGYFADRKLFRFGGYEADMSFFGPGVMDAVQDAIDERPSPSPRDLPAGPPVPPQGLVAIRATEAPPPFDLGRPGYRFGVRHGQLLRGPVRDFLKVAETQIRKEARARLAGFAAKAMTGVRGVPSGDLIVPLLVRAARRLQREIPPEHLDEMEGIADAAGVPYDAILVENAFLTLAEQTNPLALLDLPARCTNAVALGEATSMGQLIHASTLDWGMHEVLKDRTLCMVMEPAQGHPFVSVGWPGMVGTLRAMGAQGIAVSEESCAAPDDTRLDGVPINILLRDIVQFADDLDGAVQMARSGPGTCGYKITISNGRRRDARVVEVTARHSHVREPVDGLLFGCDPDAGPEAFVGERDPAIPRNDGSSARRYPALRELLEQAPGTLRTPLVSWALGTRNGGVLNGNTMLACVFEPQIGRFHVALGDDVPPVDGGDFEWRTHDLLPLLSPQRRATYALPRRVTDTGDVETRDLPSLVPGLRRLEVLFDSPLPSGYGHNDRVVAEFWLPRDPVGVVIELPAWKEKNLAGHRLLALTLARKGIATCILPLPYQASRAAPGVKSGVWTLSADLARTREAFFQGLADVARASAWLEEAHGFEPARQGVCGVSLGGHVAAAAYGVYPDRFAAGVFILAGGHIERSFMEPNRITRRLREALLARGVTATEARGLIGVMDPLTYARRDRSGGALLIAATEDPVVPPDSVRALAAAYGGAHIEWLEGDHYAPLRPDLFLRMIRRLGEHCANVFGGR